MRKILFVLGLMMSAWVSGQTITLVPNPDTVFGISNTVIRYNNSIICTYRNSKKKIQLAMYDGSNITLIPNPDSGTISYNSFFIRYNNAMYFAYVSGTNDTLLGCYDGTNLVKLNTPNSNYGLFNKFSYIVTSYVFKNNLYLVFRNKINNQLELIKYDGNIFTVINNPNSQVGVFGSFFEKRDTLFFTYIKSIDQWDKYNTQLAKLSNNTITLVNKSSNNNQWSLAFFETKDTLNQKNYGITTDDSSDPIPHLAVFSSDTVKIISLPNWISQGFGSGVSLIQPYQNNLIAFISGYRAHTLLYKFDGNNFYPIDTSANSWYQTSTISYNNKLYCSKHPTNSYKNYMCKIDFSNTYNISNPDTVSSIQSLLKVFQNKMIVQFLYKNGTALSVTKLAVYDGVNYLTIDNPDNGYGVQAIYSNDTLNNRFYFPYVNINNKTQLAYIDFGTLPLKLLSFTTKLQQKNVLLNWQTVNEVNVSHINIQRSVNGKDFTTIGKVYASCCNYEFTDDVRSLEFGIRNLYYRLEVVDKDGSKQYSETKNLVLGIGKGGISIYPNPSNGNVTIECAGAKELLVVDYLGREISRYTRNDGNLQSSIINIKLLKGVYIVKAIMNNGDVKTEKLLVE